MLEGGQNSLSSTLAAVLALVVLLQSAASADAYGFDCGQGSAMLFLTSHSQCGSKAHMACFASLAMRVKQCHIKAWPHHPNSHHRPCWGLQLLATVSDVNSANGSLTIPMHGSGRHISVPAQLSFSRPREAMLLVAGPCSMTFSAVPAPEDTLAPVPGEGRSALSSLLRLLVPAVLVPAVVVALLLVAAGRTPAAGGSDYSSSGSPGGGEAGTYHQLPDTSATCSSSSSSSSSGSGAVLDDRPPCTSLLLRTFNLKAMSRRARARRLRRHTRPVYVGPPQPAGGPAGPGGPGGGLVAPFFRFPPVALPPGLEAIPESVTPSSASGPPSRASSSSDLDCDTRLLPAAAAAAAAAAVGAAPQQQQQQQARAAGDAWLVGLGTGGGGSAPLGGDGSSSSSQPLCTLHPWSRRVQQHSLKQQLLSQQFLSSLAGAAAQPDCGDRLLLGAWFQQQQQQQQWPEQSAAGLEPARQ